MSMLDTFLTDAVSATLQSDEASACCLDIVRTTATREINMSAIVGEVKLYLLGTFGALKGAELDHNLFLVSYERSTASTLIGEEVGTADQGLRIPIRGYKSM